MNFRTIFPVNIFVYFFNHKDIAVKQSVNTELFLSRQVLVWKKNTQTQSLECGYVSTNQAEEEPAPYSYLLAC
ncbi:hypothetical protein [Entomomonas asaccharolytica]|uniref:Uncharacterized protein n=1 Tax=Entomomonas asaccharolytica TaxID=2785331 RepID=A0A974NE55_9GAMM|nr:hypothetical protein [Entomomonas asaccharolytica]QQP84940.1 hypothetical protein JHT90_11130 [Entomomonas asaccharolytica]